MIRLRPRLSISAAAALASFLLLPSAWRLTGRLLAAWDIAALLYFGLAWVMMAGSSLDTMRQRAQQEDERAVVILALTALAAVASLGAIGAELSGLHADTTGAQAPRLALAGATTLCSCT